MGILEGEIISAKKIALKKSFLVVLVEELRVPM